MLARLGLRSVAGAARGMLGLPPCMAEASAASAPGALLRHFADQAGGDSTEAGAQQEGAEASSSGDGQVQPAGAPGNQLVEGLPDGIELTQEELDILTKRQQAYLGLNPEKYKHFLPRLSRGELGSYADEEFQDEFEEEVEMYPQVPDNVPLYNLRDVVPEIMQPQCEMLDKLVQLKQAHPGMTVEEMIDSLGIKDDSDPPPYPGAQPILRWHTKLVMSPGVDEAHPANKRVRLRVYLRELQREAGLSEAALHYIARICGPRYNPKTGELLLTSEKYALAEDNRRHCMEMLVGLVEEGQRAYPSHPPKAAEA